MHLRSALVAAVLLIGSACDSTDTPAAPAGSVTITSSVNAATIPWVGTTTIPLTIARAGGFTGPITLTAESVPTGVSVAFTPATLAESATSATVTLTATTGAAVGTSTIAVRASGSGINSGVVTFPVTINPPPGVTIAAGTTTALASPGGTIAVPIVVSRVSGYTGDITLAVDNVAATTTASFSPAVLTGDQRLTILTLAPSATATAGTTALTIRATGTGMTAQTIPLSYTVRATSTTGFSLSASPAALIVMAGQSATSALAVTRTNGFPSFVDVSATGAPSGMTVTITPNPSVAAAPTVTIATTAATLPGVYPITLTGVSTGAPNATASLIVVVTPPPGG